MIKEITKTYDREGHLIKTEVKIIGYTKEEISLKKLSRAYAALQREWFEMNRKDFYTSEDEYCLHNYVLGNCFNRFNSRNTFKQDLDFIYQ